MLDDIRERIGAYLVGHRVGVVSAVGSARVLGMPVRYRASGLEVDLLIPRWADLAFCLDDSREVLLVVWCADGDRLRWLEYRGAAGPGAVADRVDLLPVCAGAHRSAWLDAVVHLTPVRIDLFDESQGWGARETLEME